MNTELQSTAARVEDATSYFQVFGSVPDESLDARSAHVKMTYRQLARVLHPDRYTDEAEKRVATAAFTRLQKFLQDAQKAVQEGIYGKPVNLAVIQTRKARHTITSEAAAGDLTTVYHAETQVVGNTRPTVVKVARRPGDKDLLQAEATALRKLRGNDDDKKRHVFVPELVDSFSYQQKGQPRRQANVLAELTGFYTLEQVRRAFPGGLSPLHVAWIWRRVLYALGFVHKYDIVHGAVLPSHIMILPEKHGVVLNDWCYSSSANDEIYPPIKAAVDVYKDWYPEEVLARESPSPATDIFMASRCMIELMGGNPLNPVKTEYPKEVPRQFRAFFKGCLQAKQNQRPQNAWQLLGEFDELLVNMGRPYYPRKFRPLTMPSGMA